MAFLVYLKFVANVVCNDLFGKQRRRADLFSQLFNVSFQLFVEIVVGLSVIDRHFDQMHAAFSKTLFEQWQQLVDRLDQMTMCSVCLCVFGKVWIAERGAT